MFKENYLTEIPDDILEIIDMYWRQDDYNIHIKTERDNFSWRYNSFIDDRMHKSICRLNYVYKAGVDTRAFTNRAKIAGEKLKNHIDDIIKYINFNSGDMLLPVDLYFSYISLNTSSQLLISTDK